MAASDRKAKIEMELTGEEAMALYAALDNHLLTLSPGTVLWYSVMRERDKLFIAVRGIRSRP